MKSYYKYLESTHTPGAKISAARKPVYRSSAIFPVIENKDFHSKISFMGYWILKREINEIALLVTLRDREGGILHRHNMLIQNPQAFSLEVGELLKEIEYEKSFVGSIELEIFSTQNLVFPYPAFVLSYYNDNFITTVHTAGRIYNDVEDWLENDESKVPESGFDIHPKHNLDPFFAFTNGPFTEEEPRIDYELINHKGKSKSGFFRLKTLAPYETFFVFLKEFVELDKHLDGQPGTVKLKHAFKGFFPRFVAGNMQNDQPMISITHSYYDTSSAKKDSDYWNRTDDNFNDAAVFVPLFLKNDFYTEVIFYPIYSPSVIRLDLEFFDAKGKSILKVHEHDLLKTRDKGLYRLDFADIVEKLHLDLDQVAGVNIIQNAIDEERYPTRIKMGLNIGQKNKTAELPCNICFNAQVGNPDILKKSRAFRWAPFLNKGNSTVVLSNPAPIKNYDQEAKVTLNFYREGDNETLQRKVKVAPFAQVRLELDSDEELKEFFQGKTGWLTAESENPFIFLWYFDFLPSGAVAGDHGF